MPLQSSGSGQQRERRRRHHHHHHHHQSTSATTRTNNNTSASSDLGEVSTLAADTTNGHGAHATATGGGVSNTGEAAMVRYSSSSNGVEMNGFGRRGKSQSPAEVTSLVPVSTSGFRNGSANGQAWRLTKVFNENDEALINRKLPKELLLRIFSHLDVVSLCRCAQVLMHLNYYLCVIDFFLLYKKMLYPNKKTLRIPQILLKLKCLQIRKHGHLPHLYYM